MVQLVFDLDGPVDARRLRSAAQKIVDRHASLRAGFITRGVPRPVQAIARRVKVPWREEDLRGVGEAEGQVVFERWLARDRGVRFDFSRPPLVRFALFRFAEDRYRLVMTNHHILLDGWSTQLLMREFFLLCEQEPGDTCVLPSPAPWREYLAWCGSRDRGVALEAWCGVLAGVGEASLVGPVDRGMVGWCRVRCGVRCRWGRRGGWWSVRGGWAGR